MKNILPLKYPAGEFTQAELATFNGQEKLVIYPSLKEAEAKGIIVKTGTRPTGKRPANLYKVADPNAPVPVPAPPVPQPIVETPTVSETPPVVDPVPAFESALKDALIDRRTPNAAYPCPLCQGPMTEIPDATGVTVKCFNTETCDPQCHENPYGHSTNAKAAYEIARQKYQKPSMN